MQAVWQQTPSIQKFDEHSLALAQGDPLGSRPVHFLFSQPEVATQSVFVAQEVPQTAPAQT